MPSVSPVPSPCRSRAFGFAHGGPRVDAPPRALGADTDAILTELGYDAAARDALRAARAT